MADSKCREAAQEVAITEHELDQLLGSEYCDPADSLLFSLSEQLSVLCNYVGLWDDNERADDLAHRDLMRVLSDLSDRAAAGAAIAHRLRMERRRRGEDR